MGLFGGCTDQIYTISSDQELTRTVTNKIIASGFNDLIVRTGTAAKTTCGM